jgi:antitoxin HigA-1
LSPDAALLRNGFSRKALGHVQEWKVLREDYLKPLGMSVNALAKALHVPASRINDIVLERRGMTPDTALRVTRYFGGDETDAQGWVNLQAAYDFKTAARNVGKTIAREVRPRDQDQTAHA